MNPAIFLKAEDKIEAPPFTDTRWQQINDGTLFY